MTKTNNSMPEAYIAVAGNRQKIYPGAKVYLDGGTEFQLELFNPTSGVVAAKIYINDEPISNSLIVLRPGVREYLDRYLDDNKKFLFDTYTVEDTKEVKEAIASNGNIKVEFFKSVAVKPNIVYPAYTPPFGSGFSGQPFYDGTSGNNFYGDGMVNATVASSFSSADLGQASMSFSDENINEIETGRIEGGGASDQNFTSYSGEFEQFTFFSTEYQIMPTSTQPIEISQIRQYCPGCRNRIRKSSWNWCPTCGEELN